jgi:hypothetical protein
MQFYGLLGGGERVLPSDALSCSIVVAKLYGCGATVMVLSESKASVRKGVLSTELNRKAEEGPGKLERAWENNKVFVNSSRSEARWRWCSRTADVFPRSIRSFCWPRSFPFWPGHGRGGLDVLVGRTLCARSGDLLPGIPDLVKIEASMHSRVTDALDQSSNVAFYVLNIIFLYCIHSC